MFKHVQACSTNYRSVCLWGRLTSWRSSSVVPALSASATSASFGGGGSVASNTRQRVCTLVSAPTGTSPFDDCSRYLGVEVRPCQPSDGCGGSGQPSDRCGCRLVSPRMGGDVRCQPSDGWGCEAMSALGWVWMPPSQLSEVCMAWWVQRSPKR
eukprot:715912-Prorocentrum_minimum.AAC.5